MTSRCYNITYQFSLTTFNDRPPTDSVLRYAHRQLTALKMSAAPGKYRIITAEITKQNNGGLYRALGEIASGVNSI